MGAIKDLLPGNEAERIEVLKKYEILDTPPDGTFDKITELAAQLLDVPISIVSLVDKDRIWFKSRYGLDVKEIDRDPGLCASAILQDDLYMVKDAAKDARTLTNPLVVGEMGLRFYAAIPLKTKEGYNLGTLCVIDKKPRTLSIKQQKILQDLADLVISQMELRMEARTTHKNHHELMSVTAHDLKNPLAMMPLLADMIINNKDNPKAIEDIAKQIRTAGKRMNKIIEELLEKGREESGKMQLRLTSCKLEEITKVVVESNRALAKKKNQKLELEIGEKCTVCGDKQKLTEVFDNLINNAIKFSPPSKEILVKLETKEGCAVVKVQDEGPGLTKDDKRNLFRRYTSLSAEPTGEETSSGLGLSIAKNLVDAHKGKIYAESKGKGKGSLFVVELPLSELA